jgi:hypothetical protein
MMNPNSIDTENIENLLKGVYARIKEQKTEKPSSSEPKEDKTPPAHESYVPVDVEDVDPHDEDIIIKMIQNENGVWVAAN